jgi:hypothetical protein
MISRIRDWLHERRIARLHRALRIAVETGQGKAEAWQAYAQAHRAQSERAVRRMEESKGLRPRTTIKRALVAGYCRRLIPGRAVSALFAVFRLRGL